MEKRSRNVLPPSNSARHARHHSGFAGAGFISSANAPTDAAARAATFRRAAKCWRHYPRWRTLCCSKAIPAGPDARRASRPQEQERRATVTVPRPSRQTAQTGRRIIHDPGPCKEWLDPSPSRARAKKLLEKGEPRFEPGPEFSNVRATHEKAHRRGTPNSTLTAGLSRPPCRVLAIQHDGSPDASDPGFCCSAATRLAKFPSPDKIAR